MVTTVVMLCVNNSWRNCDFTLSEQTSVLVTTEVTFVSTSHRQTDAGPFFQSWLPFFLHTEGLALLRLWLFDVQMADMADMLP